MRAVVGSVAAWAAVLWVAGAAPGVSAEYRGMTQDLLLRSGPSPVRVLWLISLGLAMGLSLLLLARLQGRLDAGRPVGDCGVVVLGTAVGTLWVLVWLLAGAPAFGPLPVAAWPAD